MNSVNNYAIATILCLQTACHCIILTVGQYIYASYLQIYPYSSNTTANDTLPSVYLSKSVGIFFKSLRENSNHSSDRGAQLWAQEQSADLLFRIDLWNSCPLILMTYILGLYTPKLGRQVVLILPMLGSVIQLVLWLVIIHFHLADYWWYIASFIVGLSGSSYVLSKRINSILIDGCFSLFWDFVDFVLSLIITDNTNENNRSSRFVLFEAMTTAVSALVTFEIGYYINWRGFTDLYWISLGLQILSIVVVILYLKNPSLAIDERTSLLSPTTPNDVDIQIRQSHSPTARCHDCFNIFKIFSFQKQSRRKSISLLLILFAYIFYLLAYSTYASFLWYLLDDPFDWSSESVGNYTALASIFSAIFSLLGMKLFTRIGMNDTMICIFSHLCFAASSSWIAFARHSWQLYAGLLISPYADYQNSLTLPMMSKWLTTSERNHAYTLVAEVNTIITTFGDSIFNWVYARTVAHFRNFTLLLAVGFSILSFILNV